MGHSGTCPPQLSTILFLVHFGENLTANYPSIVYSARLADANNSQLFQSVLHSHKTVIIIQLLHPALKFAMNAPWPNFQLCPSSQQILTTPLSTSSCWLPEFALLIICPWSHFHAELYRFKYFAQITRTFSLCLEQKCLLAADCVYCMLQVSISVLVGFLSAVVGAVIYFGVACLIVYFCWGSHLVSVLLAPYIFLLQF